MEYELNDQVSRDLCEVKDIVRDSIPGGDNIYQSVLKLLSDNTRNTPAQVQCLDALEQALSVFRVASRELRKGMDVLTLEYRLNAQQQALGKAQHEDAATANAQQTMQAKIQNRLNQIVQDKMKRKDSSQESDELARRISDAIFFSNRYALFFAGQVGLGLLGSTPKVEKLFSFGNYDNSKDRDALTALLAKNVAKDLNDIVSQIPREQREDGHVKETLESVFTTWVNQFQWSTFKDVAQTNGILGSTLRYKEFSVKDGSFKQKHNVIIVDEKFMPQRKEDIIGSKDFVQTIWGNLLKLATYDVDERKNPCDPASVIFTYGEPGCGKTYNVHAIIQSYGDLCKSLDKPCWLLTHSTTDYASHYQNKTANELADIAKRIADFKGSVVMYIADADVLFQSRKREGLTIEQQQTLGVYFKWFDGTMIPKNGKFMAIMDANYIDGIDDATKSRLFDEVLQLKRFGTAEEFAELARRSIEKGANLPNVSPGDWMQVGHYLLESGLSNREIGHVVKKLRRGYDLTEDMLKLPTSEHYRMRNDHLAGITKQHIIDSYDEYMSARSTVEVESRMAKISDDTDRFLAHLMKKKGKEIEQAQGGQ